MNQRGNSVGVVNPVNWTTIRTRPWATEWKQADGGHSELAHFSSKFHSNFRMARVWKHYTMQIHKGTSWFRSSHTLQSASCGLFHTQPFRFWRHLREKWNKQERKWLIRPMRKNWSSLMYWTPYPIMSSSSCPRRARCRLSSRRGTPLRSLTRCPSRTTCCNNRRKRNKTRTLNTTSFSSFLKAEKWLKRRDGIKQGSQVHSAAHATNYSMSPAIEG